MPPFKKGIEMKNTTTFKNIMAFIGRVLLFITLQFARMASFFILWVLKER